jgi:3-phenylpropionate/cinnamic acid dioxygenase small subunit
MPDMLTPADRVEITELMARYACALSDRDWDAFAATFAEGATADYTTAGGVAGTVDEALVWLQSSLGLLDLAVSQVGTVVVDPVDSDTARVRSLYRMVMRIGNDEPTWMEASGWYHDTVVRTSAGWRIAERREDMLYLRPS